MKDGCCSPLYKRFIEKYQDEMVYGTDMSNGIPNVHINIFVFWESEDEHSLR